MFWVEFAGPLLWAKSTVEFLHRRGSMVRNQKGLRLAMLAGATLAKAFLHLS